MAGQFPALPQDHHACFGKSESHCWCLSGGFKTRPYKPLSLRSCETQKSSPDTRLLHRSSGLRLSLEVDFWGGGVTPCLGTGVCCCERWAVCRLYLGSPRGRQVQRSLKLTLCFISVRWGCCWHSRVAVWFSCPHVAETEGRGWPVVSVSLGNWPVINSGWDAGGMRARAGLGRPWCWCRFSPWVTLGKSLPLSLPAFPRS